MPNLMSFHKPFLTLDDLPDSVGLDNWTIFPYVNPTFILGVGELTRSDYYYLQSYLKFETSTINNEVHWTYFFHKGVYDLTIIHATNTYSGILTIKIDDVVLGTPDFYSDPTVYAVKTIFSDIILSKGNHTLKIKIEDRHASSTSYNMRLGTFTFRRTS